MSRRRLAREFTTADISRQFRANGSTGVDDPDYIRLAQGGFADWRLTIDGLVERPLSLSLEELRALPARTQITRHDCVEGWSCIGQWTGVRLSAVLQMARLRPQARYIVFHCADALEREGRSWHGLHRHALMTMIAYAFLQHHRFATARRGKKNQWTATALAEAAGNHGAWNTRNVRGRVVPPATHPRHDACPRRARRRWGHAQKDCRDFSSLNAARLLNHPAECVRIAKDQAVVHRCHLTALTEIGMTMTGAVGSRRARPLRTSIRHCHSLR